MKTFHLDPLENDGSAGKKAKLFDKLQQEVL